MNWLRQLLCSHEIERGSPFCIQRPVIVGGYGETRRTYMVDYQVTLLSCKKCGYTKKVVA
jgi:hypothetical protein